MEFLRFTFQDFWTFIGVLILIYLVLDLICNTIIAVVKCVCHTKLGKSLDEDDEVEDENGDEESLDD